MKNISLIFYLCFSWSLFGQLDQSVLRFDEFLGYVKMYHPTVKQASLIIDESQAALMKSRGAFDPKIEVDYDRKKFKASEYYDKLNASFKIPTWYGIELKANFEENVGDFLNPESQLPVNGLYSAGISFSVAQGLLINKRMAALKQAKLYSEQVKADREITVNKILFDAALVYFNWLEVYNKVQVYDSFLKNAQIRFKGVKSSIVNGDKAAIDSVEARIAVNDRLLNLEKSKVKLMKATNELSNFLWLENNIPVELQSNVIPDINSGEIIDITLQISELSRVDYNLEMHPKLQSLRYKYDNLEVERRLKANMLLPRIELQYNFLSETPETLNTFNTSNYKAGVYLNFPIFLRKERGNLKLAELKMKGIAYEISSSKLAINNKIDALWNELESYKQQNELVETIASDYELMVKAEERKFELGESSLFLVNSRETKLIDAKMKVIDLQNMYFSTKAMLFNSMILNVNL